jgi:hypothetical protein
MKTCKLALAFCAMAACLAAQGFQAAQPRQDMNGEAIAPGLKSAILRSLLPGTPEAQPNIRPRRFMAPPVEEMSSKCAVRLLEAPIPATRDFTMQRLPTSKNADRAMAVKPPVPACPEKMRTHQRP